jgi:hypothetical protein
VFKWGNVHILLHTIADDTLICEDMNTKSLRNVCEYPDGRKVLLKQTIKMKMDNCYIFIEYASETDTCFSFDEQNTTRITQAKVLI